MDQNSNLNADLKNLDNSLKTINQACSELDKSYATFHSTQNKLKADLKIQLKQYNRLKDRFKNSKQHDINESHESNVNSNDEDQKQLEQLEIISKNISEIKDKMPKGNNFYLSLIVGSELNVVLPGNKARRLYKIEYEKFKFNINVIMMVYTLFLLYLNNSLDSDENSRQSIYFKPIFLTLIRLDCYLALWYYCTLTVRESILIANGSKIKGWWIAHHYLSILICGLVITIPNQTENNYCFGFLLYMFYNSFVSLLQFTYQKSALYGLTATGKVDKFQDLLVTTDIGLTATVAKFMSLTKLLPFLFSAYLFQFYNSFKLIKISWIEFSKFKNSEEQDDSFCWQLPFIGLVFMVLAVGNSVTMFLVLGQKYGYVKNKSQNMVKKAL